MEVNSIKLASKKDVATMLQLSTRSVDNLMAKGMPYLKLSKSVRFDLEQVADWVKNNHEVRRFGKEKQGQETSSR